MKDSIFPNSLSNQLLRRAQWKCEYCKQELTAPISYYFEKEHVVPVSRSNDNSFENLAVACRPCNLNKSNKLKFNDPKTGKETNIFNPRQDRWLDHFKYSNFSGNIIGQTSKGRATAKLLKFNKKFKSLITLLSDNDILCSQDNIIIQKLHTIRLFRLNCEFENTISYADHLLSDKEFLDSKNSIEIQYYISTQVIESYFTESFSSDSLMKGIRKCYYFKNYFGPKFNNFYDNHLLTLYGQLTKINPNLKYFYYNCFKEQINHFDYSKTIYSQLQYITNSLKMNVNNFSLLELKLLRKYFYDMDSLEFTDPLLYINSLIKFLDLALFFPEFFNKVEKDLLNCKIIKANNLLESHFSYDKALYAILQKRILLLNRPNELIEYSLSKDKLIIFCESNNLFNHVRDLKLI